MNHFDGGKINTTNEKKHRKQFFFHSRCFQESKQLYILTM